MEPSRKRLVYTGIGLALIGILGIGGLASRGFFASEPPPVAQVTAGPPGTTPDAGSPVVYDPTKLLDADVPAGEVWDKEPRSDTWATATEVVVGGAMSRDLDALVPGARVTLVCKTLSCLVGIDAPEDKRPAALAVTKFFTLGPWVVDLPPDEDGTLRWLFFQEPRFGDATTFTEWYKRQRKQALDDIRAGKRPNPFPVAPSEIPKD